MKNMRDEIFEELRAYFERLSTINEELSTMPWESDVRFGCDCGCGGDYYTDEEWDSLQEHADELLKERHKLTKEIYSKFKVERV